MLDFLKRLVGPDIAPPARRPATAKARLQATRSRHMAPPPVPEASEVDWSVWEDSVADSEMQSLGPPKRHRAGRQSHSQFQDTQPSGLQDVDAFSRVSKSDP